MKFFTGWIVAVALALTGVVSLATPAQAEGPAVTQVLIVDVEPQNMEAYMGYVTRAQAIVKELDLPDIRVLQATMAGDQTGSLAILIESESLAALAANQAKTQASDDWQKMIGDIRKAGISRIDSNSLWVDVTP